MKIDKGIPVPKAGIYGKPRCYKPKYPLRDMKVGDSFLVECTPVAAEKKRLNVLNAVNHLRKWYPAKHSNWQFKTHVEPKGVRIWRVKNA